MKTKSLVVIAAVAALHLPSVAKAIGLASGSAMIDYDQAAWESLASGYGTPPVLTLSEFFDQAAANARTAAQISSDDLPGSPSYTGQAYDMNGPTVVNLAGRTAQPTTFDYTPGSLTSHTGSIGLGGVARFDVFGGSGGSLLYGDFTLQYDATRLFLGGTGWYLKGNIPPAAAAFDILNVSVVESPGSFTISGDLYPTYEVANFLYATPSDQFVDVGDFTFTGVTAIPEPTSMASVGGGGLLLLWRGRKRLRKESTGAA